MGVACTQGNQQNVLTKDAHEKQILSQISVLVHIMQARNTDHQHQNYYVNLQIAFNSFIKVFKRSLWEVRVQSLL